MTYFRDMSSVYAIHFIYKFDMIVISTYFHVVLCWPISTCACLCVCICMNMSAHVYLNTCVYIFMWIHVCPSLHCIEKFENSLSLAGSTSMRDFALCFSLSLYIIFLSETPIRLNIGVCVCVCAFVWVSKLCIYVCINTLIVTCFPDCSMRRFVYTRERVCRVFALKYTCVSVYMYD